MSSPLERIADQASRLHGAVALTRHVRTQAGSHMYHLPIGAPIVAKIHYPHIREVNPVGKVDPAWGARVHEIEQASTRPRITDLCDAVHADIKPTIHNDRIYPSAKILDDGPLHSRLVSLYDFRSGGVQSVGYTVLTSHGGNSKADIFVVSGELHPVNSKGVVEKDKMIGSWERRVSRSHATGEITAMNDHLEINFPRYRHHGFATAFNRHIENWYIANHVKSVGIVAGLSQGGYVWARAGFDWDMYESQNPIPIKGWQPGVVEDLLARIQHQLFSYLGVQGHDVDVPRLVTRFKALTAEIADLKARNTKANYGTVNFPTPYELSEIGREELGATGSWPGKEGMMGSQWDGIKYLVPPES